MGGVACRIEVVVAGHRPTVSKPSYLPLNGNSEPPFASVVAKPSPDLAQGRGWSGRSCARTGCREDTETNDYVSHVMTSSGIPPRKPVSTRCLPPRGAVMFHNSYRRRLRSEALRMRPDRPARHTVPQESRHRDRLSDERGGQRPRPGIDAPRGRRSFVRSCRRVEEPEDAHRRRPAVVRADPAQAARRRDRGRGAAVSVRSALQSGSVLRIDASVSGRSSPGNARFPVRHS